jgi:glycosyltransferase involved in cell wall biosynthesis
LHAAAPQWQNIELLPNGLDLEAYPFQSDPPVPGTLIYPGSVTYEPNRDAVEWMARDILPRIRSQVPDARFRVTGRVPASGGALETAGLEFTGYVSDVKPEIARSWVCALPLRLGAGGTRFKALEALALGSPLVSTAIGYEGLDVTDNVNVLMAEDAVTFADRCVSLLKSPELRLALVRNGRRLVEDRYNWASLGQRLVERIASISDMKRRSHFPERAVNVSPSP